MGKFLFGLLVMIGLVSVLVIAEDTADVPGGVQLAWESQKDDTPPIDEDYWKSAEQKREDYNRFAY